MSDIYLERNYGRLYETIEGGTCEVFEYQSSIGTVRHLFIKKEIPSDIQGGPYYDLLTPYGYGGPEIKNCENSNIQILTKGFAAAFQQYCEANNIVSEFVRFHPIFMNAPHFTHCYSVDFRRLTTGTTLKGFVDPVQSEYSRTSKKNIRRALRNGVTYELTLNPKNLKNFIDIYYVTMKRNNADPIYYFNDKYFADCLKLLGENTILTEVLHEGKVIGAGLSFVYNNIIHTHLSGTLAEYHHLFPAYILQYALTLWGKENGIDLIHDGGGRTGKHDDSLFLFKKQFGKNTEFDYHVGYRIWNEKVYDQLCEAKGVKRDAEAFPAYRQATNKKESSLSR